MIRDLEGWDGAMSRAKILSYDTEKYKFAEVFAAIFQVRNLSRLHDAILAKKRHEHGQDSELKYRDSRLLRDWLAKQAEKRYFYPLYNAFVRNVLGRAFGGRISFAQRPRFRVHLAGGPGVSDWHRDTDITGRYDQITAWLPAVDCRGANSLWLESDYGLRDYRPVTVRYGEVLLFDGGLLHGSVANDTDVSRVGFDLRFAPRSSEPGADLGILSGREGKLMIPENPQPVPNPATAIRY